MDQQTPQRQRSRPPSPVRVGSGGGAGASGVSLSSSWNSNSANASNHNNSGSGSGSTDNNTATIMPDVTRSVSMESRGANSIATYGSGSAASRTGGIALAGGNAGGELNCSIRASPVPSFRSTTTDTPVRSSSPPNNNSLTTITAVGATTSETRAVQPPPWPTTATSSSSTMMMSTPQRCVISSTESAQAHTAHTPFPPLTPPPLVNMTHSSSNTTSSNNNNNKNLSINLSISKSGDSFFSQGAGTFHDSSVNVQQQQQQQAAVLLGLEELERQQADVEKRREKEREEQQRRFAAEQQKRLAAQQQHSQQGLPPLPPPHHPRRPHDVVPSQIHLDNEQLNDMEDEEDTILSSDGLGGGRGGNASVAGPGVLKRVVSIEKFRGSVNSRLQRLRSWSQDALHRSYVVDPATGSSVDSTQPATLTTDEGGDGAGGGGSGQYKLNPTSSGNGGGMMVGSTTATPHSQQQHRQSVKSCKKMMFPTSSYTTNFNNSNIISEPYLDEGEIKPLVYGYLYKLGRNGHWQRRFFETDGERLTYYKNVKRTTVLATLDLCKVGEIAIDETDPDGCTFTIQVKNRPYYLRAADKARCNDWVIILNRAREARMHVGNIQLATATTTSKVQVEGQVGEIGGSLVGDSMYRSQTGSDDYAQPCIVISALRPRTRALMNFVEDEGDNLQDLLPDLLTSNTAQDEEQIEATKWDTKSYPLALQEHHHHGVVGVVGSDGITRSMVGSGVGGGTTTIDDDDDEARSMAKWQKRHSTWHILSVRFLRWARSISRHADACRRENDVMVVPSHVVMASQKKHQQSSGRASAVTDDVGARGGDEGGVRQGQGGPQGQKQEDLMDSTPVTPGARSNADSTSAHNRLRANTESPAFGITYV